MESLGSGKRAVRSVATPKSHRLVIAQEISSPIVVFLNCSVNGNIILVLTFLQDLAPLSRR